VVDLSADLDAGPEPLPPWPYEVVVVEFLEPVRMARLNFKHGERWMLRAEGHNGKALLSALETGAAGFDFSGSTCPVKALRVVYRGRDAEKIFEAMKGVL
jgi:hypothetical protein